MQMAVESIGNRWLDLIFFFFFFCLLFGFLMMIVFVLSSSRLDIDVLCESLLAISLLVSNVVNYALKHQCD